MKTVVYLCDQQKKCKGSPACGQICTHTEDPTHAKNGITFDAENDPRFEEYNRYWWEKEDKHDR